MKLDLWARWKRFAQRAAEIQGQVVFALLYFICVVPLGLLTRRTHRKVVHEPPRWLTVEQTPVDLAASRRQF